jgi:hypothetical protein
MSACCMVIALIAVSFGKKEAGIKKTAGRTFADTTNVNCKSKKVIVMKKITSEVATLTAS